MGKAGQAISLRIKILPQLGFARVEWNTGFCCLEIVCLGWNCIFRGRFAPHPRRPPTPRVGLTALWCSQQLRRRRWWENMKYYKSRRVGENLQAEFLVLSAPSAAGKPGLAVCVLQKLGSTVLRSRHPANRQHGQRQGCVEMLWRWVWGRRGWGHPLGTARGLRWERNGCVGPSVQVTSLPPMSAARPIRSSLRSQDRAKVPTPSNCSN